MATISIPPVRDSALVFVPATVSVQLTAPDGSPVIGALGTTLPTEYTSVAIPPAGVLLALEPQAQIAIPYGFATWYEITITSAHLTEVYRVQVDDVLSPQDLRSLKGVAGITPVAIGAEPALTTASQAEMEAGTVTALRSMTPQRVAQAINAINYQDFTVSGTWTKPVGPFSTVFVCITGGGGGGGAGARRASGVATSGGGGGGSGAIHYASMPYADVASTVSVIVGGGGLGAPATTIDDTDGAAGSNGGTSSFGTMAALYAYGGGGGKTTSSSGGSVFPGFCPGRPGAAGSVGAAGTVGQSGTQYEGGGAASGGGISTAPAAFAGGSGGITGYYSNSPASIITQTIGGAIGQQGDDGIAASTVLGQATRFSGAAGAGGGSSITGPGGRGGHGGNYGAPGGGGGSSLNGFASGAGGNGSGGRVQVWVW